MIPLWFQACIYWKKFVIWRHHFLRSIFSMIGPFFDGSAWSDPYVKDTVYFTALVATIYYNKRSVVDSKKIEEYVYFRKTIVALLRDTYLFHRTSCNIFLKNRAVFKRLKAQTEIPYFHGEYVRQFHNSDWKYS